MPRALTVPRHPERGGWQNQICSTAFPIIQKYKSLFLPTALDAQENPHWPQMRFSHRPRLFASHRGSHSSWVRSWLPTMREINPDYWQHLPGQSSLQCLQTSGSGSEFQCEYSAGGCWCRTTPAQSLLKHSREAGLQPVILQPILQQYLALLELRAKMLIEVFLAIFAFSLVFFYKWDFPLCIATFTHALYKASAEN